MQSLTRAIVGGPHDTVKDHIKPIRFEVITIYGIELVASFVDRHNLLKYEETMHGCAAYFSDGTTRGSRSWPPRWPECAGCALRKTRNQHMVNERLIDGLERSPQRFFRRAATQGHDRASGGAKKELYWNAEVSLTARRAGIATLTMMGYVGDGYGTFQ